MPWVRSVIIECDLNAGNECLKKKPRLRRGLEYQGIPTVHNSMWCGPRMRTKSCPVAGRNYSRHESSACRHDIGLPRSRLTVRGFTLPFQIYPIEQPAR
jgi:hypothetical protein